MIVERTLTALGTAAAVVAAVFVSVVAAFFTIYALVEPLWGAPVGGAVVAITAALLAIVIALVAARRMDRGRHAKESAEAQGAASAGGNHADMAHIILRVVKDKPLLSAGAAVAVGFYALRNPALISAVMRGFLDAKSKP